MFFRLFRRTFAYNVNPLSSLSLNPHVLLSEAGGIIKNLDEIIKKGGFYISDMTLALPTGIQSLQIKVQENEKVDAEGLQLLLKKENITKSQRFIVQSIVALVKQREDMEKKGFFINQLDVDIGLYQPNIKVHFKAVERIKIDE
jgi:hypothetical protein